MAIDKEVLDQLLAGREPQELFAKDGLLDELKKALSERMLTADALVHEALLPAPDAGLRLARLPHDRSRAETGGAEQHDLGSPDVLLGGVAIARHSLKAETFRRRNFKCDPCAHDTESHAASKMGILKRTLASGVIH